MTLIRNEVRVFTKQIENIVGSPKSENELVDALTDVTTLLAAEGELKTFQFSDLLKARILFIDSFFVHLGRVLLDQLTFEWISNYLNNPESSILFDNIFLLSKGSGKRSFVTLVNSLTDSRPGVKQSKCVSLLERFLQNDGLCHVIWEQCCETSDQDFITEELHAVITSLPDKTANTLQMQNSDLFLPQNYVPLVGRAVLTCLTKTKTELGRGRDVSLVFISHLIARFCMIGFANNLWGSLLPELTVRVREDYIWCRVCERLTTGLPDRCLDTVIGTLLRLLPWYGLVEKFLGDGVVKRHRVQYILCTKLLLLQHSDNLYCSRMFIEKGLAVFHSTPMVVLLHNILGYLSGSHTRRPLFIKTMLELLKVWGDSSAVKHSSPEQHLYLTQALLVCCAHITTGDKQQHKDEILRALMPGVQIHISSSEPKIRKQGMIVAQTITSLVDPKGPQLQFEMDKEDKDVVELLALTRAPEDPDINKALMEVREVKISSEVEQQEIPQTKSVSSAEDLDSDDDLEPYDLSNDVKSTKVKQPKYLRECMEGLISSGESEADRREVCLATAERLIRGNPDGLDEIAEEFSKILLHLSDKFSSPGFTQQRFSSLVALTVLVPIKVSRYLTQEFYERNYNLRQRMDILEVISSAVQELSKPMQSSVDKKPSPGMTAVCPAAASPSSSEDWHEVVRRRIESKTRRFVKGPSKAQSQPVLNRFSGLAGYFFFPLLKNIDSKDVTFDLFGSDSLVLGRLVYTLGVIMHASLNTLEAKKLGSALLQFTWSIRFHSDIVVRHAVLFAVSMVILSVPGYILMSELQQEVLETKQWLEDTVEKSTDPESRKLALQGLVLLENVIKKEFSKDNL